MKAPLHLFVHCFRFIVVALTNVGRGLVIVGFLGALVACGLRDIHVEPATSMSLLQTVETDSMLDARVKAHNIPALIRGDAPTKATGYLEPMHWPEPYSANLEGTRAYEYHLGYAAARLIRQYYAASHPHGLRIASDKLVDIVDAAGGTTDDIYEPNRDWPIEIADIEKRLVFEVVPPGETHRAYGKKKADFHLMFVNQTLFKRPQFELGDGFSGEMGVRFGEKTPPWKLTFQTVEPGVIAYRWLVLSVAKLTDEAHIEAYLQNRWHEPTPNEMARLGRSLHLVVEKLVQARESLGQIRARTEMPMVPGQTMSEYVRALSLWSAHDSRIARLLPVMRTPPPPPAPAKQVGRNKQFLGNSLPPQVPNESWTTDGRPGNKPHHFHLGSSAHKIIAMHYRMLQDNPLEVATNFISIKTIVRNAGGDENLVLPHEALLRPDIATWGVNKNILFEIKPDKGNYLVEAQAIVGTYLAALNRGMVGQTPFTLGLNYAGNLGVKFDDNRHIWNLVWRTAAPGVLLYKLRKLSLSEEDQALAQEIRKLEDEGKKVDARKLQRSLKSIEEAYNNDHWIELSETEMEAYGRKFEEAVDLVVGDRQLILETQGLANVPIEVVGRISSDILTAELNRHLAPPKPKAKPPAKGPPAVVPRPGIPQNDNGVPTPALAPGRRVPPPKAPVYKPKKAA